MQDKIRKCGKKVKKAKNIYIYIYKYRVKIWSDRNNWLDVAQDIR